MESYSCPWQPRRQRPRDSDSRSGRQSHRTDVDRLIIVFSRLSLQTREAEQSLGQRLKAMENDLQLVSGEKEELLRLQEALRVSVPW